MSNVTTSDETAKDLNQVLKFDSSGIQKHLDSMVKETVEQPPASTPNDRRGSSLQPAFGDVSHA